MSSRPQNIGIKAIEIYFPSQVRFLSPFICPVAHYRWVLGFCPAVLSFALAYGHRLLSAFRNSNS
jgi:hypothetical protein